VAYNTFEAIVPRPHASSIIVIPIDYGADVTCLRVRSGTALVPVAQSSSKHKISY
jgi:hypothetical protein